MCPSNSCAAAALDESCSANSAVRRASSKSPRERASLALASQSAGAAPIERGEARNIERRGTNRNTRDSEKHRALGSPLPSAGEGLGVRGPFVRWINSQGPVALAALGDPRTGRAVLSPSTPTPLPAGERGAESRHPDNVPGRFIIPYCTPFTSRAIPCPLRDRVAACAADSAAGKSPFPVVPSLCLPSPGRPARDESAVED